jgi:hypothetical protein
MRRESQEWEMFLKILDRLFWFEFVYMLCGSMGPLGGTIIL